MTSSEGTGKHWILWETKAHRVYDLSHVLPSVWPYLSLHSVFPGQEFSSSIRVLGSSSRDLRQFLIKRLETVTGLIRALGLEKNSASRRQLLLACHIPRSPSLPALGLWCLLCSCRPSPESSWGHAPGAHLGLYWSPSVLVPVCNLKDGNTPSSYPW